MERILIDLVYRNSLVITETYRYSIIDYINNIREEGYDSNIKLIRINQNLIVNPILPLFETLVFLELTFFTIIEYQTKYYQYDLESFHMYTNYRISKENYFSLVNIIHKRILYIIKPFDNLIYVGCEGRSLLFLKM